MIKKIFTILKNPEYFFKFVLFFIFYFFIFLTLPVLIIPGNTYQIQLSTYNLTDYFLLFILIFLSSLIITLQIYLKNKTQICKINSKESFWGSLISLFASILGTSSCAGCISPIIAYLGLSFSFLVFLLKYQNYISLFIIFLLIYFIFKILKKIN